MKLSEYISQERGRGASIATAIGVSPQQVYQWANGSRPTPKDHGAQIEIATGGAVTRQEMFPDDWQRMWPELIQSKTNRTSATAEQIRETGSAGRSVSGKEAA
jgi:DNA-binding transcriptional regulator YdaS (Cro superfamily)